MTSGDAWQPNITRSINPFDLLFELGRDCVGAIQLLANDPPADLFSIQQRPLTESDVARILRNSWSDNAFVRPEHDEDLRLSIAGAQEKTALLFHDHQWCLPYTTSHHFMMCYQPIRLSARAVIKLRPQKLS